MTKVQENRNEKQTRGQNDKKDGQYDKQDKRAKMKKDNSFKGK